MKKIRVLAILIIFIAVAVLLGLLLWWRQATSAPSTNPQKNVIIITRGSSAEKIGNVLKEAGVIKNKTAFKLYLQKENLTTAIPPGKFEIAQNLTLSEVVVLLLEGPTEKWVTVPEGLRREQVPLLFVDVLELKGEARAEFINTFLLASADKEGYLFPDTYLVSLETTGAGAVSLMENTFNNKVSGEMVEALANLGFSLDEGVILASLLERETLTNEERPVVAGILYNRLKAGWPLQVDATVQYAMANDICKEGSVECEDWWPRPITSTDLKLDSPYNTYMYPGLPPTPISNPGISSLKAVAFPENTDYWFYLHDPDGNIHYAKTLAEHNQNIVNYLNK